jgi:hypothetical protein
MDMGIAEGAVKIVLLENNPPTVTTSRIANMRGSISRDARLSNILIL